MALEILFMKMDNRLKWKHTDRESWKIFFRAIMTMAQFGGKATQAMEKEMVPSVFSMSQGRRNTLVNMNLTQKKAYGNTSMKMECLKKKNVF